MKRLLLFLLPALMLNAVSITCFAEIQVSEVSCIDGNISITGKAERDASVAMRFQRSDTEVRDFSGVFAVSDTICDADGNFSFRFLMPDEKSGVTTKGEYTIKLATSKDGKKTNSSEIPFQYSSKPEREELLGKIRNAASSVALAEIFRTESKSTLQNIGVSEKLLKITDSNISDEAARLIFNNVVLTGIDEQTLNSLTETYLGIANINKSSDFSNALEMLNPCFEDKNYCDLTAEQKSFVRTVMTESKPYGSKQEFDSAFAQAMALYAINNAKYTAIARETEIYADILSIKDSDTYKSYISYADNAKNKIGEIIIKNLKQSKVVSQRELLELIGKAIKEYQDSLHESNPTGGSPSGKTAGTSNVTVPSNYLAGISNTQGNADGDFYDVTKSHWAYNYIMKLAQKKVVSGYSDHTFLPNANITREEFVTMLICASGIKTEDTSCSFTDVESNAWYEKYIATAVRNNIVSGISESLFGRGQYITREDAAVMVCKATGLDAYSPAEVVDADDISGYAYSSVMALYNHKILSGDQYGRFLPRNNITRAEAAKILCCAFGD